MVVTRLSELVSDWGGFERLVAEMHDTGDVRVEHDIKLVGQSGVPRQIDVAVWHTQGFYEHLVIIECKYLNRKVQRSVVDSLITAVSDIGASKGVIFSKEGFSSGAIETARGKNIDLFIVRDVSVSVMGKRYIRFTFRFISYDVIKIGGVFLNDGARSYQAFKLTKKVDRRLKRTKIITAQKVAGFPDLTHIFSKASKRASARNRFLDPYPVRLAHTRNVGCSLSIRRV